jgi:hypothetical protein
MFMSRLETLNYIISSYYTTGTILMLAAFGVTGIDRALRSDADNGAGSVDGDPRRSERGAHARDDVGVPACEWHRRLWCAEADLSFAATMAHACIVNSAGLEQSAGFFSLR